MTLKRNLPITQTHKQYELLRKFIEPINPHWLSEQSGVPLRRIYKWRQNKLKFLTWPEVEAIKIAVEYHNVTYTSTKDSANDSQNT